VWGIQGEGIFSSLLMRLMERWMQHILTEEEERRNNKAAAGRNTRGLVNERRGSLC